MEDNYLRSSYHCSPGANMANWRSVLARVQLRREEFQQVCADAVRERFPTANVELDAKDDRVAIVFENGQSLQAYLENVWRLCQDPENRLDQVENLLSTLGELSTASEQRITAECIVATVRDSLFIDAYSQKLERGASLAMEPLAGDLFVVYAADSPRAIRPLSLAQLDDLKVERTSLKSLAIENLRRILPPVEQHGEGPLYMLTAGGDYVSSLLLLDDVWNQVKDIVEGDVVAAVPSRDVVFFTGSRSPEGLLAMRNAIERVTQTGDHLVSTGMFHLSADGWKVFS